MIVDVHYVTYVTEQISTLFEYYLIVMESYRKRITNNNSYINYTRSGVVSNTLLCDVANYFLCVVKR